MQSLTSGTPKTPTDCKILFPAAICLGIPTTRVEDSKITGPQITGSNSPLQRRTTKCNGESGNSRQTVEKVLTDGSKTMEMGTLTEGGRSSRAIPKKNAQKNKEAVAKAGWVPAAPACCSLTAQVAPGMKLHL